MQELLTEKADKLALADEHLNKALCLLDDARRFDVAAHVDLALHILRGTRDESCSPDLDTTA
jgi:hypothetical protein